MRTNKKAISLLELIFTLILISILIYSLSPFIKQTYEKYILKVNKVDTILELDNIFLFISNHLDKSININYNNDSISFYKINQSKVNLIDINNSKRNILVTPYSNYEQIDAKYLTFDKNTIYKIRELKDKKIILNKNFSTKKSKFYLIENVYSFKYKDNNILLNDQIIAKDISTFNISLEKLIKFKLCKNNICIQRYYK